MIRRIALRNWRAYERADIPFEQGTTFVVAPNGIGKSSLLEAAQFAFNGQLASAVSPVMLGKELAEVELALQLTGGTLLVIHRSLSADPSSSSTLRVTLNGNTVSDQEFAAELDRAFRAAPDFIARNAFLRDSLRDIEHTDLRSLLARAFDLDSKRAEAARLAALADELKADAEQLSRAIRSDAREVGRLEGELAGATTELSRTETELARVRGALEAASDVRTAYLAHVAVAQRVAEWDAAATQVLDAAREISPRVTFDRLASEVEALAGEAEAAANAVQARMAAVQARLELIDSALEDLRAAGANCPVCLRPFGEHDQEVAEAGHRAEANRLRAELATFDVDAAKARVSAIRQVVRQVDALGPRPDGPPQEAALPTDPQPAYEQARADLERAAADHQAAQALVAQLTRALDEAHDVEVRSAQSERAWRHWALTSAASTALFESIDDVLRNEIVPVRRAVGRRWNDLFADRPDLHFDLDGNQWRDVRGHRLPLDGFSAGEQTAARLLMQLAILTTATRVDFCWFDEPLEHLDPRTRRLVAGMLAHGRKATGLRQLVVTTYEEELAAQLADADDLTAIEYVRAGPMAQPD
jgi:DNA repair exonuclease SbcCD ATPase subunit